jgi:threonyl-tRNA synthetase
LGIGPVIEHGFYYDFQFPEGVQISDQDLQKIEELMKKYIKEDWKFMGHDVTVKEAKKEMVEEPFKLELIEELEKNKQTISIYESGPFKDLCRGGHVHSTKEIPADGLKVQKVAGAYWRGSEKNPMLTRIYGLLFENKNDLEVFLLEQEEARKRDHKKLGPELDLFFIDEKVGKGLPMWTPKGTAIKFELENFTRSLERKYGYEHVSTPYLGAEELYRTSGHLDHYSHNMYAPIDMDGEIFYLRPMACPHHIRMYQRKNWSYRELPVRYAEIADYNRYEKSGELMGMIRVRKFQLTDAHIFVSADGLKDEFKNVTQMIIEGMQGLGLGEIVSYRFSKRDPNNKEKYYPDDNLWNHAENLMKEALDELGIAYVEALDEAAFYGPKLDVQARNVNGKEDTLFTAQMDFLLPQKFGVEYTDSDGLKKCPVMIHRSTIGALERTFAFLIEHYAGAFPLWLAPVQVQIIPVSQKFQEGAAMVAKKLGERGIRVGIDVADETVGNKVRKSSAQKIPYIIVLGGRELEGGDWTVRVRGKEEQVTCNSEQFITTVNQKIENKTNELSW